MSSKNVSLNKFFIPIDRSTIKYDPKYEGPYLIPTDVVYEQVNSVKTIGKEVKNGVVQGESKIHYLGDIRKSSEYQEVYGYISPLPQFKYDYVELLVQCEECYCTLYWSDANKHFDYNYDPDGLACVCGAKLNIEFETLSRQKLEQYAGANKK